MKFKILSTVLLFGISPMLWAQVKIHSPVSYLGMGNVADVNSTLVAYSGGLSASYASKDHINMYNPASLSKLETVVFEGTFFGQNRGVKEGDNRSNFWEFNPSYLTLAMPLQNRINALFDRQELKFKTGLSFTLKAYDALGYDFSQTEELDGQLYERNFVGQGSNYVFSIANGWSYKHFRIGYHLGYFFGDSEQSESLELENPDLTTNLNFNSYAVNKVNYKGFEWRISGMYDIIFDYSKDLGDEDFAPNKYLTLGLIYNGSRKLKTEKDDLKYRRLNFSGIQPLTDTLQVLRNAKGIARIPHSWDFGAQYVVSDNWSAGVNFTLTNWSLYTNEARPETEQTKNTFKLATGFSLIPNHNSIVRYFDKIRYGFGVYYQTDPRTIDDEQFREFGIRLNFDLPIIQRRQTSYVNFGLGYSRLFVDQYSESIFRMAFTYSFTDNQWFLKRKYD